MLSSWLSVVIYHYFMAAFPRFVRNIYLFVFDAEFSIFRHHRALLRLAYTFLTVNLFIAFIIKSWISSSWFFVNITLVVVARSFLIVATRICRAEILLFSPRQSSVLSSWLFPSSWPWYPSCCSVLRRCQSSPCRTASRTRRPTLPTHSSWSRRCVQPGSLWKSLLDSSDVLLSWTSARTWRI